MPQKRKWKTQERRKRQFFFRSPKEIIRLRQRSSTSSQLDIATDASYRFVNLKEQFDLEIGIG